jgi:hypothetical protein
MKVETTMTKTMTMRVPEDVHHEVQSAARLLGCPPAELLERAWSSYRQSLEFKEDFSFAQKALAIGDLDAITARLQERSRERAERRAAVARSSRTGEPVDLTPPPARSPEGLSSALSSSRA